MDFMYIYFLHILFFIDNLYFGQLIRAAIVSIINVFHPFLFGDNLDNIYRNMNCCHCQCIWMNLKWCEYFERWNFCRRSVIRTWCFLWASCWGISECDICHFKFAGFFFSICYRFYIVHSIFFNDTCGRWFVNSCKVYFENPIHLQQMRNWVLLHWILFLILMFLA